MRGVFRADSGFCTAGVGKRTNNCGNIRPGSGKYGDPGRNWVAESSPGNGYFRKYQTLEDGIYDNVALYVQLYEGMAVRDMQRVWARAGNYWGDTVFQSLSEPI